MSGADGVRCFAAPLQVSTRCPRTPAGSYSAAMPVTIMLVDDNRTFVSAVRRYLGLVPGVKVIAQAHEGDEALAEAARLQPDLVLLDIGMPTLNGLAVARHLQSLLKPPRIVFLSVHEDSSYRDAAREFGAAGYINKSDFVVGLLPIIERLIYESEPRTGESSRPTD